MLSTKYEAAATRLAVDLVDLNLARKEGAELGEKGADVPAAQAKDEMRPVVTLSVT